MRFSTIAAFATSLAVVSAQTPDLSQVPDCAVACLVAAIPGSGCGVTDVTCQCTTGQGAITSSLEQCLPSRCSAEDIPKVASALAGVCSAAGISVSVPASVQTMAPSGAASSAASAATSAMSSMMSSAGSAMSSAASSAASAASSAAASASSRAASATSGAASATSSGPAQSTGGAVANAAGLGAVVFGVVAALL